MSTPTTAPTRNKANVVSLMVALLVACIAFQLNASMLSPALVTMGDELGASQATIGLTQTWFFTAAALFSLFLPRLSDIIGRKRVMVSMMILLAVGSLISACSQDVSWLFLGRIVAGVSGPTVPMCLIMLRSEISDNKQYGLLMGLVAAVNGGIAGVDSFLGGYFADHFGFRSIFWLMVILAVVAFAAVQLLSGESKPSAGTAMDWAGVVYIVVAIGALLTALNEGAKLTGAWDSGVAVLALVLVVLAAMAFIAFWKQEQRSPHPMVETRHLVLRETWAPLLTTMLTMTGIFAVINGIVPAFVQATDPGFGYDATTMSLLILTPYAVLGWIVGPLSGRLAPALGYTKVLRIGLIGSVVALLLIAFGGFSSIALAVLGASLLGIAYAGTANIMLNGLGVVLSPKGNPGFLPGMNAGAFNLGAGLSFLVLPTVQSILPDSTSRTSYMIVVLVGVVITAIALVVSTLIPTPQQAEEV